jgi:hypothetical protein
MRRFFNKTLFLILRNQFTPQPSEIWRDENGDPWIDENGDYWTT